MRPAGAPAGSSTLEDVVSFDAVHAERMSSAGSIISSGVLDFSAGGFDHSAEASSAALLSGFSTFIRCRLSSPNRNVAPAPFIHCLAHRLSCPVHRPRHEGTVKLATWAAARLEEPAYIFQCSDSFR